jgi:FkbM family methyltransferase
VWIGLEQFLREHRAQPLREGADDGARYVSPVHGAEYVVRSILAASPQTLGGRARLKALIALRRLLVRVRDPLYRWPVGDADLLLPLSHPLPFYRHDHPLYDSAIGAIAAEAGGPVVDIGANVGDTAAEIRSHTNAPILCVEGDDRFFTILARNAPQLEPVELEHAFVEAPLHGRVERGAGTTRVVEGESELRGKPLNQILAEHPDFARPALVKLDTDGMDVPIILANLDFLARVKPVLFFEYDPHLGATPEVFDRLHDIGYGRMDVYENTGEYVRTVDLPGDIHDEYVGHGGARYADVCVRP